MTFGSKEPIEPILRVRAATSRFADVNFATPSHYAPFLGCVTVREVDAMGVQS